MRPFHVAIVGSGPSGFFAAASLCNAADAGRHLDIAVDMLEMLPTRWGRCASGVTTDHPKFSRSVHNGPQRRRTRTLMMRRSARVGVRQGLRCGGEDRSTMPTTPNDSVKARGPTGREWRARTV